MTARDSKRKAPESPAGEILSRAGSAETITNRTALDLWVETLELTPRMRVLVRLAQSLADEMDSEDWTAPIAREHRVAIAELAELIAGEGEDDGEAGLRLVMSAEVRDSA